MTFNRRNFFNEFIDDFYAESDEHLANVRRQLLALDAGSGSDFRGQVLEELLRSFHTLKGLSSMVGCIEVEQLSHHTEEYLRQLKSGSVSSTSEGAEALIEVAKTLEAAINALRSNSEPPEISAIVARLVDLAAPEDKKKTSPAGNADAVADEGSTWKFEFSPSADLAGRGVGVGLIRERLESIGRIVRVSPLVNPHGGVSFEFLVNTNAQEDAFGAQIGEGVRWSKVEERTEPIVSVSESASLAAARERTEQSQTVVRVEMSRLDDLMRIVGELVTHRWRLEESLKPLEAKLSHADWRRVHEAGASIERELSELREAVMRVRMVPIGQIFERMRFVVYALERESDKKIRLELSGENTEVDKLVVERMMEPLLHIVRNAISHGLESQSDRITAGKPAEGVIRLRAATVADRVVITIEDDGQGMDFDLITEHARSTGALASEESVDATSLLRVLCTPGFSTREKADLASGRGVGMAVVNRTIQELGGTLALKTERGVGTHFTVTLPLTLAIADALIVSVGDERYAMPQSAVDEVLRVECSAIVHAGIGRLVPYRGSTLPLIRLADVFGVQQKRTEAVHVMVVGRSAGAIGLAVDRVLSNREIVVRSISDPLMRAPGFSGATEVGDGRPILIIDPEALVQAYLGRAGGQLRGTA